MGTAIDPMMQTIWRAPLSTPTLRNMDIDDGQVVSFAEKSQMHEGWINGGFFVLSPRVVDYIEDEGCIWEQEPMKRLAAEGQLAAFRHAGFWQCMDTLRDLRLLEELWARGDAPWRRV